VRGRGYLGDLQDLGDLAVKATPEGGADLDAIERIGRALEAILGSVPALPCR
jgi:hypothetical protein